MPRFFQNGAGWISQVPVVSNEGDLDSVMEELVNAEILRLARDEKMDVSMVSRVVTITARRLELYLRPGLTLRFNILNGEPIQFAYRIVEDGKKHALVRDPGSDRIGIYA